MAPEAMSKKDIILAEKIPVNNVTQSPISFYSMQCYLPSAIAGTSLKDIIFLQIMTSVAISTLVLSIHHTYL